MHLVRPLIIALLAVLDVLSSIAPTRAQARFALVIIQRNARPRSNLQLLLSHRTKSVDVTIDRLNYKLDRSTIFFVCVFALFQ